MDWIKDNSPRRISGLSVLLFLLFLGCCSTVVFSERNIIARGANFDLYFENGNSLRFQHLDPYFNVTISVGSGTLNGTNGDLFIRSGAIQVEGDLIFRSQDSASLSLSCDHEDVKLSVNGSPYIGSFNIKANDKIHIRWVLAWNIFVWTLPILGVVGCFCVVASPYYIVTQLRKKTADALLNAWMYGLLLFILGLGLVICWLWS